MRMQTRRCERDRYRTHTQTTRGKGDGIVVGASWRGRRATATTTQRSGAAQVIWCSTATTTKRGRESSSLVARDEEGKTRCLLAHNDEDTTNRA